MTLRRWACAGIVAGSLFMATPAWSQTYTGVTTPTVADNSVRQTPPTTVARGNLVVTGGDILELIAIGTFAVSAGALGVRLSRGRPEPGPTPA